MLYALILYVSSWIYSLTSTLNDRFLLRKFWRQFIFTLRDFARNLLRENRRRNTFRFSFWCLAWDSNPGFMSNKPTHFLLAYSVELLTKLWNWVLLQETCGGWWSGMLSHSMAVPYSTELSNLKSHSQMKFTWLPKSLAFKELAWLWHAFLDNFWGWNNESMNESIINSQFSSE